MLAQQPRATPQHRQGALTLLPASQVSRARAVRRAPGGHRLQVPQVPKEFGEEGSHPRTDSGGRAGSQKQAGRTILSH